MAAPHLTHVIELASPAFVRPRYVRRINRDGGFTVTTQIARARRFDPTAAARSLTAIQPTIEAGAWTPAVVPAAAEGGAS